MALGIEEVLLVFARVLFGGVVAFMGLNHFMQVDEMAGYAQHKGLPAPKLAVLGSGAVLVFGGLAIVTGAFPVVGGVAVAAFLLVAAVTMHDFWAVAEDQQRTEMTQFLKNVALAGGALALGALGTLTGAYSLGISLL